MPLGAAKQAEKIHVANYNHTTPAPMVAHGMVTKVPIQWVQRIRPAEHGGMNGGLLFRLGWNHARSRARKDPLGDLGDPEVV